MLDAGEAHAVDLSGPASQRLVRVHDVPGPALVLGSTQPDAHVDHEVAARAGIPVVRRRSGGGAVLVAPGEVVWCDVVVPADDVLWRTDVGVAFEWLGEAWVRALSSLGVTDAQVHRGALVRTSWSDRVCFAGLGSGEVTREGRKVVGISQRRTRYAARFQCAALLRWDVVGILGLLALTEDDRARGRAELADVAAGLDEDPTHHVDGDDLVAALLRALP
jgi:lipoate-protein ligase A